MSAALARSATLGRLALAVAAAGALARPGVAADGAAQAPPAAPEQFRVWGARAKAHPYLADPGPDMPRPGAIDVTADERARGFVAFTSPASLPIRPDFAPTPKDRAAVLEARDCPGQYGPIVLGILALDGGQFEVTATDLVAPGGRRIGAENLQVRAVRYVKVTAKGASQVVPLLLESFERLAVPAGRIQPLWITYHVPPEAAQAPGWYQGAVRIAVNGAVKLSLPLRIEVYPFALAEPDLSFYVYYNNGTQPADLPSAERHLIDQRCHGMNQATLVLPITRDGEMTAQAVAPWLDMYSKAGLARRQVHVGLWNRITAEWLNSPDRSIGMWGPWFRYYPFSDALDRRYVRTVRMLDEECRRRDLRLVLSVADEPGSHPWTTQAAQHYNDLVKASLPDVRREMTVGGGWAMGRPEHELWKGRLNVWTTNRWLADKLELVRRDDPAAAIQVYNMAGAGSAPGGIASVRAFYGLFLWKTRAAGAAQWTYYHSATPEDNYTWPAEDADQGHVPTLRWEMAREGAKDRRYLATLEQRLTRLRPDKAGRTDALADEARAFLDEIAAKVSIATDAYDPVGGGRIKAQPAGAYESWRDRIAEFIRRLDESGRR